MLPAVTVNTFKDDGTVEAHHWFVLFPLELILFDRLHADSHLFYNRIGPSGLIFDTVDQ